jgi:hypothetical protein
MIEACPLCGEPIEIPESSMPAWCPIEETTIWLCSSDFQDYTKHNRTTWRYDLTHAGKALLEERRNHGNQANDRRS